MLEKEPEVTQFTVCHLANKVMDDIHLSFILGYQRILCAHHQVEVPWYSSKSSNVIDGTCLLTNNRLISCVQGFHYQQCQKISTLTTMTYLSP